MQENSNNFFNKIINAVLSFFKGFLNFFIRLGLGIYDFFRFLPKRTLHFFKRIKEGFINFINRFKDGDLGTKLSHFIMGSGNFYHKQYAKGIIFLIIQIGFLFVFFTNPEVSDTPIGFKSVKNFITLGTNDGQSGWGFADNSMLMLLFGVMFFIMVIILLYTWNANIKSAYLVQKDVEEGKKPKTFKEDVKALFDSKFHILLLTPTIIGVSLFTIIPTLFMILIAFTSLGQGVEIGQHLFDWVGFVNFLDIFDGASEISKRFFPVLGWTLTWAFFATFSNYIGGILLALLINKKGIQLKKVWRTIFVITIALPQFITLLAVRSLVSTGGPFNELLQNIGILSEPMAFLDRADSAWTARISVLVINLWIGIPYTMLMTSGILMNVPKDTYEAAQIDGASKFQAFRHITVPYIVFVTTPYLITSFIGNITSFNIIYLLTGGGPGVPGYYAGQTDLLVTWLFKLTIEQGDYNTGSVISIFTFIITASATLLTYRRSKAYKEEDAFQ